MPLSRLNYCSDRLTILAIARPPMPQTYWTESSGIL